MKMRAALVILLWTALAAGPAPAADTMTNAPPAGTNFNAFRLITERNIFNQNRSPRSARRESPPRRTPRVQSLSLVGTMSYGKGEFAFFEGSNSEYRKPVKAGDKIAGYQVKQITSSSVKVASDSQEFEIKVGQQLRREDDGEWQLASGSTRAATPEPSNGSAAPVSSGNGAEDEVVRRLLEKRAKETTE
jgi:hypothetical protein